MQLPQGMMASAAQMLTGGSVALMIGIAAGERITAVPPMKSVAAMLYLAIFGLLLGYTAFARHLVCQGKDYND